MPTSNRILPIVTALLAGLMLFTSTQEARGGPPAQADEGAAMYQKLRGRILSGTRKGYGIKGTSPVWGVLMDMGSASGTVTVMATADGNASLYFSTGGGMIGGVKHAAVREAATKMTAVAGELSKEAKPTSEYPTPPPGRITFYLRTDKGVLTASASEEDLQEKRHALWKLYWAGQDVITQYRLIHEAKEAKEAKDSP